MTTATTLQWRFLEPFRAPSKGDVIPVEGEVAYGARGPMCHESAIAALFHGRGVVACLLEVDGPDARVLHVADATPALLGFAAWCAAELPPGEGRTPRAEFPLQAAQGGLNDYCLTPAEAARDAAIEAHPDDEAAWASASRAAYRAAEARADAELTTRLRSFLAGA